MTMNKILLVLIVATGFLLIFYANNEIFTRKKWFRNLFHTNPHDNNDKQQPFAMNGDLLPNAQPVVQRTENYTLKRLIRFNGNHQQQSDYNIFVIFTKENDILRTKLELFVKSLLKYTSVELHLHLITDEKSEPVTEDILKRQIAIYKQNIYYTFYNVEDSAIKIRDITQVMMPHFSSTPGSYYSDALFFLSLGLHRIVDPNMRRAILIDCDVVFRTDVKGLFDEFDKFSSDNLFGLAPELTPVYRHILYKYRLRSPDTTLGTPYYPPNSFKSSRKKSDAAAPHIIKHGNPGFNSGVVMLNFRQIRKSKLYHDALNVEHVERLTKKYFFKGNLGDQDYYTLLGFEFPSMFYRLDCVWNRQLCTWWKDHGYSEIFDQFFHCEGKIRLYHGNCNTRVPE